MAIMVEQAENLVRVPGRWWALQERIRNGLQTPRKQPPFPGC